MKRLIFIVGSTETLEYFSLQMAEYFLALRREVFLWDMRKPAESITAFEDLPDKSNSVLITFNFIGLGTEGQFKCGFSNVFDEYGIEKICIMVDSPVYYYRFLSPEMLNTKLVCIDGYHKEFVEKYYPFYGEVGFMPLGGNLPVCSLWAKPGILKEGDISYFRMGENFIPGEDVTDVDFKSAIDRSWANKGLDILFIGNYVPLESLDPSIKKLGPDYREFVMSIVDEFLINPSLPLEHVLMDRLVKEFPDASKDEFLEACYQLIYVDLYVRNLYRGKIVTAIADRGIKVHCTGKDWDKAPCKRPENIIHTGDSVVSIQCLEALSRAKISLNMMPWFKDGAHDRVFSSMLFGCALVSDSSKYMDKVIEGGKDYLKYDLKAPDETAFEVSKLVYENIIIEDKLKTIAANGLNTAFQSHTWKNRAAYIHEKFIF
ncbi:MAG: glycosyltransferase [Lachnospiraceae bacterium]|nr:glycosyltransferase [Lachnospiraceae bacterium]